MRVLAVTNMYPTPEMPAQGTFVEQQVLGLKQAGLDIRVLHIRRVEHGRLAYLRVGSEVRRSIRRDKPDLVHVMYGGILSLLAARAVGEVPLVVSFCGSDLHGEPACRGFARWLGNTAVWASHRSARAADGIIVKSRRLEQALPPDIQRQNLWIAPNGVDLDRFKPMDRGECRKSLGWKEVGFHILFTGDPKSPTKRFELARQTVDLLLAQGIPVELHVMRGVKHSQVPVNLNAADVLLLCSEHEGSPNIVKEALACNRPVVSVDVGDVRERIEGVAGCYLARADAQDLAAKLQLVAGGPREVIGRNSMSELSVQAVAGRLVDIYTRVLAGPPLALAASL